jgi:hypothetical protein
MTSQRKSNWSRWLLVAHIAAVAALGFFVPAPTVHAQTIIMHIPEGTSTLTSGAAPSGWGSDTSIVEPCQSYKSDACIIVAAFNSYSDNYWYLYDSEDISNGLPDAEIFFYVNYVYEGDYYTNGGSSPGAIVVIAPLDTTYTFQGAEYYESTSCVNQEYYQQGWDLTTDFNTGTAYALGIPYYSSGSQCGGSPN